MTEAILLDWLGRRSTAQARQLKPWRPMMTRAGWQQAMSTPQSHEAVAALFHRLPSLRPLIVDDLDTHLPWLWQRAAEELVPQNRADLVLTITLGAPDQPYWTVTGPGSDSPPHLSDNPLHDARLRQAVAELRTCADARLYRDDPMSERARAALRALAERIGERLTSALLSEDARRLMRERIDQQSRLGRARLLVRSADESGGELADAALALPWELLMPVPGEFAVKRAQLDIARDAVAAETPTPAEVLEPLRVAVSIAAPADQSALNYEEESFRLQCALESLGHQVAFADLGGADDLVALARHLRPHVLHFSGHGQSGALIFENEIGFSDPLPVSDLVYQLRRELARPGVENGFPRLFYLSACCEVGAALSRSGFAHVVVYSGPIGDDVCTAAEEAFYRELSMGQTPLQAVARARAALAETRCDRSGRRFTNPLGWSRLAVYQRGADAPLARPDSMNSSHVPAQFRRTDIEVSGLPVLQHGFIGRRALQHEVRRRIASGQRLLVFQGLGGLGKTALASHVLCTMLAKEPADQLILRARGLTDVGGFREQAEQHGRDHGLPDWDAQVRALRESMPETVAGFEQIIEALRRERPGLVIYADNVESLQAAPRAQAKLDRPGQMHEREALGSWLGDAGDWWTAMERLSDAGLVLASTRYIWPGLPRDAWLPVEPMGRADIARMLDTFPALAKLSGDLRRRIATHSDGRPATLTLLGGLAERLQRDPTRDPEQAVRASIDWILNDSTRHTISGDLVLDQLWVWLSGDARAHARALTVLSIPAPRTVIDALGVSSSELIRAGLLTHHRQQTLANARMQWRERWTMHSLIRQWVHGKTGESERRMARNLAGCAYRQFWMDTTILAEWEVAEAIGLFHANGDGNEAWPLVFQRVLWLREQARFQDALTLLQECEPAGTTDDALACVLALAAQMRVLLGDRNRNILAMLERAAKLASDDDTRASILREQATFLSRCGRYDEAEPYLQHSLSLYEQTVGTSHPDYPVSLQHMGELRHDQGMYEEAELLLRRCLPLTETHHGQLHPSYGTVLHSLAQALYSQGQYDEAERLLRRCIAIDQQSRRILHPQYANTLHQLANIFYQQDKLADAEGALRASLHITQQTLGPYHPSFALSLHQLAVILTVNQKYEDAREVLQMCLYIKENTIGTDHPSYARSLSNLAAIAYHQEGPNIAESLLRRVLSIFEASLGSEHPSLCTLLCNLSQWCAESGRIDEAIGLIKRAHTIAVATLH